MKKVLIIAYYFPPSLAIGAQRPYKLAKYFPRFGWDPIVLTPKLPGKRPEGIKVIETGYRDNLNMIKGKIGFNPEKGLYDQLGIKTSKNYNYPTIKSRFIKLLKEIILYPDEQCGWYKYALNSANKYILKENVDAIISTSYPVTSHLIARKLKQKYNLPWIADLRDLWTQNPYLNKFLAIRYFERRLELRTLSYANVIVTVTKPWINSLRELHKNKKIVYLTNGYDDDDFSKILSQRIKKFTITYTGILYNGKRDPSLLFSVIDKLIKENRINKESVEIRFYGPKEGWLTEEIKKYNLEEIVNCYGLTPRQEVLARQRESQLLLLLIWNDKKEEGFCPAKIYEYFGSRRPIVAFGWRGSVVRELLEITNAGKFASNFEELRNILLEYYQEFERFGEVQCRSNSNVNNYTYDSIAKKYSDVLNNSL